MFYNILLYFTVLSSVNRDVWFQDNTNKIYCLNLSSDLLKRKRSYLYHKHISNHIMQQCSQQAVLIILQTLSIMFSQGKIPARRARSEADSQAVFIQFTKALAEDRALFVKCMANKTSKNTKPNGHFRVKQCDH